MKDWCGNDNLMKTIKKESFVSRRKRKLLKHALPVYNRIKLACRWCLKGRLRYENYDGMPPLVVSLTSYPPRFPTLHLTLKSLLLQSVRPTRLILWIASGDAEMLPRQVTALEKEGLEIRFCEDIKSYKKIIPALTSFPDAMIVTADDDIYYWRAWLMELLDESRKYPQDVIAHRVHRMQYDREAILPYRSWLENVTDSDIHPANFPTGIGGVLYPSGCFHSDVHDREKFMRLCPNADDVWLYWMTRLNGGFARRSLTKSIPIPWRGSQVVSLWKENRTQNDVQIAQMVEAYGHP